MEEKKSSKANLENKKLTFGLIGLIISLAVAWSVFEIKSYDKREFDDIGRTVEVLEEEMVEITKQEQKPQPVEVPKQTTQIQVVEDDVEVEDVEINVEVDQTKSSKSTWLPKSKRKKSWSKRSSRLWKRCLTSPAASPNSPSTSKRTSSTPRWPVKAASKAVCSSTSWWNPTAPSPT